ncbi:MAG: NAD-dependent protein deacylase [Clostridiales bacterium]|nr:NAD-dependent protein deacylase [Clostridiales bacterium]
MGNTDILRQMIADSNRIVFFGGAGVSTESGIPDFRSVDGLYNQKYRYPPETILSRSYFLKYTEDFYTFYKEKLLYPSAKPNSCHRALALLENKGKLSSVVTQNVDGLHQAAGSKNVLELHGSVHRNFCMLCGKSYNLSYIISSPGVPTCSCGGTIKPDVVLYEEGLDNKVLNSAISAISKADMLIVGGTSLVVYPAAGLVDFYNGNRLVLINKSSTSLDKKADLVINDSIGEVFSYYV